MATEPTPQILSLIKKFMEDIPFNQHIGLQLTHLDLESCSFSLPMQDFLVGNHHQGILHGGVISAALDAAGGTMAFAGALQRIAASDPPGDFRQLANLGTIDMRIDFLRPGRGKEFNISAHLLRVGNKVAVARAEMINDSQELVAVGTGTYLVTST